MRKLLLGAILFSTANLVATGCIFVSDDDDGGDGDGDGDVGLVNLSWDVQPACPVGGTTAELVAAPSAGGQTFTNLFNCDDGAGFIDDLPPNTYDVFINITDDASTTIFAQSFSEADIVVGPGDTITVDPFTILADEAFFSFSWQINEGGSVAPDCALPDPNYPDPDCNAGGAELCQPNTTCAADGACRIDVATVAFTATVVSNNEVADGGIFTCAPEGTATTDPLLLQDYRAIIVSIGDATGASYYDSEEIETGVLDVGNEIEDLGTVVFDL